MMRTGDLSEAYLLIDIAMVPSVSSDLMFPDAWK